MSFSFPLAKISDIPVLITLGKEFYEFAHVDFNVSISRGVIREIIESEYLGKIWLIENENEVIGYLILTFGYSLEYHGKFGLIDEIYVREKYRGQGIGTQGITLAEETCRSLGIKTTHLEVDRHNKKAQNVYGKLGYQDRNRYFWVKWV